MRIFIPVCVAACFIVGPLHAQTLTKSPCNADSKNSGSGSWFSRQERVCELRRGTLPLENGRLSISGKNGSIEVVGEDRRDVALEAQVTAQASSREEARAIEEKVQILTAGTIHAEGPQFSGFGQSHWSVNYRVHVPRHLDVNLHTENGSLSVSSVDGSVQADTTNGALTLQDLAGRVHADTVNGGVQVKLAGDGWHGAGLDARSTNGGVSVLTPVHYSAHLAAYTVNGGVSVAFPVTVQGTIHNHLETNLGRGGATIHLETVNGGISVGRTGSGESHSEDEE